MMMKPTTTTTNTTTAPTTATTAPAAAAGKGEAQQTLKNHNRHDNNHNNRDTADEEKQERKKKKLAKLYKEMLVLRNLRWKTAKRALPILKSMAIEAKALVILKTTMMQEAKTLWDKKHKGEYNMGFEPHGTFDDPREAAGEIYSAGIEEIYHSLRELLDGVKTVAMVA